MKILRKIAVAVLLCASLTTVRPAAEEDAESAGNENVTELQALYDELRALNITELKALYDKLRALAGEGDAAAQHNLGYLIKHHWQALGIGSEAEAMRQARDYFVQAVAQNNASAQYNLGLLIRYHWQALGICSETEAIRQTAGFLRQAATQGNALAKNNLGFLILYHWQALGIETRVEALIQAKDLYEQAAAQGVADAQSNLGILIVNHWQVLDIGSETEAIRQAAGFLRQAAAQGNALAQNNLNYLIKRHWQALGIETQDGAMWQAKDLFEQTAASDNAEPEASIDSDTRPNAADANKMKCIGCGKMSLEKLKKCGRCGVVRYCSQECQKGHWQTHKQMCEALRKTKREQREAALTLRKDAIARGACRSCQKKPTGRLKTCTRCKDAKYCSRECQKADWRRHKKECTPKA